MVAALLYIAEYLHLEGRALVKPFYDSSLWTWNGILGGTSLAVLTYLGFDGISTLAEEAKNPERDILRATVLTCIAIGVFSIVAAYEAQLVWPVSERFPNIDTAFSSVAQRVWPPLFHVVGLTLIVAGSGCAIGAQLGAARLLYGMGRSGSLPRSFFGAIEAKAQVPRNNVILVGVVAAFGAFLLPAVSGQATGFELGCHLQNFGALIAFMGVNAAAFVRYYLRSSKKTILSFLLPVLGFLICLLLWWNLALQARIVGLSWIAIGILIALRTGGVRVTPI
jgi:amino acid transporter